MRMEASRCKLLDFNVGDVLRRRVMFGIESRRAARKAEEEEISELHKSGDFRLWFLRRWHFRYISRMVDFGKLCMDLNSVL